MGGSGVVRLHASLILFLVFVNFCLTKKRKKKKKKKKKIVAIHKSFFPCKWSVFFFVKVFYTKFVPKITIHESAKNFVIFFVKFLLAKVSSPKVPLVNFIHILTDFYHLPVSLVMFTNSLIDACRFAQVGLNHAMNYFVLKKFSLKMATLKIL